MMLLLFLYHQVAIEHVVIILLCKTSLSSVSLPLYSILFQVVFSCLVHSSKVHSKKVLLLHLFVVDTGSSSSIVLAS